MWQPGLSNLQRFPITETTPNNFGFGAATVFALDLPVGQVFALRGTSGVRLLVVSNSAYTGMNSTADANNWIAAAITAVTSAPPRGVSADFVKFDTLSSLLTERKIGELLLARGTN